MHPFLTALQFLTRLPISMNIEMSGKTIGRSLIYYPLVGLVIGLLLATIYWLVNQVEPMLQAAVLLAVWIIITGGLHLDGLADSADAWAGGLSDRERTLAIMKDPYCGPAGVTSLVMLLLIKFVALATLLQHQHWTVLILVPVFARMLPALFLMTTPYVRAQGLGSAFTQHMQRKPLTISLAIITVFSLIFYGYVALITLITAASLFYLIRIIAMKRIGGITGDVLGAAIATFEACALLIIACFIV